MSDGQGANWYINGPDRSMCRQGLRVEVDGTEDQAMSSEHGIRALNVTSFRIM